MKKDFVSLLVGVLIAVILFTCLEVFFKKNEKAQWIKKTEIQYQTADIDIHASKELRSIAEKHPTFQWKPRISGQDSSLILEGVDSTNKGSIGCCILNGEFAKEGSFTSKTVTRKTRTTIYEVGFTFDAFGRRRTPQIGDPHRQILLFGDSFVLGEGVNDGETAASRLANMRPSTQVYNLGLANNGPNQFLYETTMLPSPRIDSIPKIKTVAIYTYMDDHLERMICRSRCLEPENNWILELPEYELTDGKLKFKHAFSERKELNAFYKYFANSATIKFFGLVWPLDFGDDDFKMFVLMMKEADAQLKKRYGPETELYVAFFPGFSGRYSGQLAKALTARNIKTLDYSNIDMAYVTENREKIVADGHPTPISQYIYAYLLNRDLPQQ
jgi:hypothetical protein